MMRQLRETGVEKALPSSEMPCRPSDFLKLSFCFVFFFFQKFARFTTRANLLFCLICSSLLVKDFRVFVCFFFPLVIGASVRNEDGVDVAVHGRESGPPPSPPLALLLSAFALLLGGRLLCFVLYRPLYSISSLAVNDSPLLVHLLEPRDFFKKDSFLSSACTGLPSHRHRHPLMESTTHTRTKLLPRFLSFYFSFSFSFSFLVCPPPFDSHFLLPSPCFHPTSPATASCYLLTTAAGNV